MIKPIFTSLICLGILFSIQATYAEEELPLPEGKNIKEWESISAALVAEKRFSEHTFTWSEYDRIVEKEGKDDPTKNFGWDYVLVNNDKIVQRNINKG